MKRFIQSAWVAINTLAFTAGAAFAQPQRDIDLKPKGEFANLGNLEPANIISAIIRLLLVVAAVVFFFMLVLGGIQWILSGGDKQKTEAARNQITAALVGLVVVFSAWAIAQLINALFGVSILDLDIKQISAPQQ